MKPPTFVGRSCSISTRRTTPLAARRKHARSGTAGAPSAAGKSRCWGLGTGREIAQKFEKFSLPFRLLADADRRIVEAYGVWGEKSLYGRKFMGTNRVTYAIDEKGKIAAVWPKVKPDGHAEEILKTIGS